MPTSAKITAIRKLREDARMETSMCKTYAPI